MYRVLTLDNESNPSLADPDGSQVTEGNRELFQFQLILPLRSVRPTDIRPTTTELPPNPPVRGEVLAWCWTEGPLQ